MELRGNRPTTDAEASAVLNAVLDAGITFIDTSIDYGDSEDHIGKAISNRRSEFFLASKCGCPATPAAVEAGEHVYTRENIVAGVNQSLARMNTDHLDLVQFHGSPAKDVLAENDAIATLQSLQTEGKIRFIASSSTLPNIKDHIGMGVFDAFQIPYSGLDRQHEDVIGEAAATGIGTIIRGGVAKGAPEASGQPKPDRWAIFESAGLDELLEDGESRTQFVLRFTLSHPDMHTTIVGTRNLDHLNDNVTAALKGPLSADTYAEAKRRLAGAGEVSA